MRHFQLLSALVLSSALFVGAQEAQNPTPRPGNIDTKAVDEKKHTDAIYGKIKNVTNGQKIVIAVDNGLDKTYSLADPKVTVRVAEGLLVGSPVKVLETEVKGNRSVDIVRNVDANAGGTKAGTGARDQQRSRSTDGTTQQGQSQAQQNQQQQNQQK